MSEVNTFASAIRAIESGDRYDQIKGQVRATRLVGAYGFPGDEWRQMAADAGLAGARWSDTRAQDAVAKRIFDQLFHKYGDWRLVAVAWKAGEEIADMVAQNAEILDDPKLKGVKSYVSEVMQGASNDVAVNKPTMPDGTPISSGQFKTSMSGLSASDPAQVPPGQVTPREALTGVLRALKQRNLSRVPAEDETIGVTEAQPPEGEEKPGLIDRVMGRS